MSKKPEAEILSVYSYLEVVSYISNKYNLESEIFKKDILKLDPVEGKLLYLCPVDYIVYKKYDSLELLSWYKVLQEEFGDFLVLEYEEEEKTN